MWVTLANGLGNADGLEDVLRQLQAVLQFTEELQRRFAGNGLDGVAGTLQFYGRLKAALDGVPDAWIAEMRAEIAVLEQRLREVARCLDEVARLKRVVSR